MTAPAFSAPLPVASHSFRTSAIGFAKKERAIITSPLPTAPVVEAAVPELADAPVLLLV
jgi:hypothetical protein